ncbi:hypothetical protein Tdes44962_MAKER07242 [Teratosphaeria destructans]|uniref:Uncharacterized protein n=1 Tax=Teratosphaeria destructans TaxID=418781 RepID=A0A9W7SZT4_9PEZI|nr:hypothetical protein Tdes44962_MAKER07242 [Teratosphaeria destructans]
MSWMDSWSRPSKSQATPAPYYLTHGDSVPYCHTCGRVIGERRAKNSRSAATQVKYCSDRCKKNKPSNAVGTLDRRIEDALITLLSGQSVQSPPTDGAVDEEDHESDTVQVKAKQQGRKGDPRVIVQLSELETAVFGDRSDPEKTYGRRKNRRARFIKETGGWQSVDMIEHPPAASSSSATVDNDDDDGNDTAGSVTDGSVDEDAMTGGVSLLSINDHIRAPQDHSEINFSAGGGERGWAEKIEETPEMMARRREGQRRAEEKELVKQVARRAVVFGILMHAGSGGEGKGKGGGNGKKGGRKKGTKGDEIGEGEGEAGDERVRRKCEALMNGTIVEPSFAKGDWEIRFRED